MCALSVYGWMLLFIQKRNFYSKKKTLCIEIDMVVVRGNVWLFMNFINQIEALVEMRWDGEYVLTRVYKLHTKSVNRHELLR